MSSPSGLLKVNYLVMRLLRFGSVRGDLQEGNGCAFRCQYHLFPLPIPFFPSTKSGFLCAFGVWNPRFRAFRAQNRGFCALFGFGTPVFGHFEHKIEVFVLFLASEPPFSGISSTKSRFLCSMTWSFEYWEPFLPFQGWCCHRRRRITLFLSPTTARQPPDASLQRPPGTTAWTDSIDRQYGPIELDRRYWNANQPPATNQPSTSHRPAANQPPTSLNQPPPTCRRQPPTRCREQ